MTDSKIRGIMIPEECGHAEKYELTAIMYHDEKLDEPMKQCHIFITEEDYKDDKAFTVVNGNMNPTLLLFPDEENEGSGCLTYDLVGAELVASYKEDSYAVVISKVVHAAEATWKNSEVDRETYLSVKPKTVIDANHRISITEE